MQNSLETLAYYAWI